MADRGNYQNRRSSERRTPYYGASRTARGTRRENNKGKDFVAWLRQPRSDIDYPFLIVVGLLIAFGLIMLFSAGSARAFANFGDSLWYVKKQFMFALLGVVAMYVASKYDYHKIPVKPLLYVSIGLLILVIIPGVGTTTNGATRWLFGFQPSEAAKIAIIVYFSYKISSNPNRLNSFVYGFLPLIGVLGVFAVLLMLEPHFSCVILIGLTACLIMFVGGAKIKHFLILGAPVLCGGVVAIALSPYRLARVVSFLNPFADAKGDGWQIVQSLYAIGSGGLFGVGLGQSRQKYQSLPEPQNDFIYSVLSEELGLMGAIILAALFAFLIIRGIKIAAKAPDLYGTLLAIGIVGIIGFQALINIAVVTSSVPVTGMPLPFFSYGGTALTITMGEMGIVLNISRQARSSI